MNNVPATASCDTAKACNELADRLSQTAHDLRTPLNAILGFVQILQLEENLTTDQLDSLNEINKAARLLNTRLESAVNEVRAELITIAQAGDSAPKPSV